MRTVRRFYFYLLALVSFEVVIWGVIDLGRTLANLPSVVGKPVSLLAWSLSMILVGTPVFLVHWLAAQRDAQSDSQERAARIRAWFLYGALVGSLFPLAYQTLALVNRTLFNMAHLQVQPLTGAGQIWSDNLIAILVNLGAAAYIQHILRADWAAGLPGSVLVETRRLYRYLWVLYALGYVVLGVQQALRLLFFLPVGVVGNPNLNFANAAALLLVGTPFWLYWWLKVQASLDEAGEQDSTLRLIMLYLLSLGGISTLLTAGILMFSTLLAWALGETQTLAEFIDHIGGPLSVAVPLGCVWAYHNRCLKKNLESIPEAARQSGLRRLYVYILSAFGLGASALGLAQLLNFLLKAILFHPMIGEALRNQLCMALAELAVGLPLWLSCWGSMQAEARRSDDAGGHARRSVLRKIYLYLALFASIVGVMVSAGNLFYLQISALLGSTDADFTYNSLYWLLLTGQSGMWLFYHIRALVQDGKRSGEALAERHAQFHVLIFDPGGGAFASEILDELKRAAPRLAADWVAVGEAPAPGVLEAANLVVLPSSLALNPPARLGSYAGQRLVVPVNGGGWLWMANLPHTSQEQARQAAQCIRQMAEDQPVRVASPLSAWGLVSAILAGLFLLQLGIAVIAMISSMLMD